MGVRKSVCHVGIKTAQRCGIFVTICMSDMYFKRIAAFIYAEAIRPPHGIAYLKIKKYLAGEASCHGEGYPPYSPFLFCCPQVFSACVYSTAVCPCRGINYVNKHILLPLEEVPGQYARVAASLRSLPWRYRQRRTYLGRFHRQTVVGII